MQDQSVNQAADADWRDAKLPELAIKNSNRAVFKTVTVLFSLLCDRALSHGDLGLLLSDSELLHRTVT